MPARHKQIGERAGHDQAMGVLFEPAIAHLDEPEHPLDDPDRMFDLGSYFGLIPIFRPNLVEQYPGKYSDTLYERLQAGRKLSLDDYRLRLLQREEAKNRLAAIAPLADALISLGSPGPAPRGLGSTGDSVFNSPTSILGAPAVTVPMLAIEGMPVGIQIVGQRHADARTVGIARWLLETMKPVSVD
jgi:Asp-tRNA(Asn)/Glu-tRNA(Gln) amidotransferase A subunit family amidase